MRQISVLSLTMLSGCAANFEPKPLPPDHPASVQGEEAPRAGMKRLTTTDPLTRTSKAQLARKEVPNPDFQNSGMPHDMSGMGGMQHDMGKMEGMDHPKMKEMVAPSPATKEAVEMEMRKTSDEMKKTSDELKAESDAANRAKQSGGKPAKSPPTPAIYTCVMHPEVQQPGPGNCPKCGMTLVKKETPAP